MILDAIVVAQSNSAAKNQDVHELIDHALFYM